MDVFSLVKDDDVVAPASGPIDTDAADEMLQYKQKLGRWRRASVAITASAKLRLVIETVHKVHAILVRIQHNIMSLDHRHGAFLAMVWNDDKRFRGQFLQLLERSQWEGLLERASELGVDLPSYVGCIWFYVCCALVNYERRISHPIRSYPLMTFHLCRAATILSLA